MKKQIAVFMCSILLLTNVAMPVIATSQSELEQQKKEINQKINDTTEKKEEVEEELSTQMKEISALDESISELDEQITSLNNQISGLQASIKDNEEKLKQKQKEHDENQELMENRLVVMYETGETTFLDMLFSSGNIIEFISNYYMLSQITQCDKELLESIENEEKEIESTKQQLEQEKEELASTKNEKEAKNNLLKAQKAEREEKASALSEEEKKLQGEIDSYNAKVKQIENDIQKILEDLRKKEEEERKKNGGSSSNSGISGLKFDGSFIWPCNNKIVTSTVKRRWGRLHKGIDIGARYENVYASASGYAYTLNNPGGYGLYIMIVHGDGYITLYGHLDSYNISYGQYVSQGQVIATSGNTGSSTAAHLHFEIRKASSLSSYFSVSPLNPLDYLPGGYTFAAGAQTPS